MRCIPVTTLFQRITNISSHFIAHVLHRAELVHASKSKIPILELSFVLGLKLPIYVTVVPTASSLITGQGDILTHCLALGASLAFHSRQSLFAWNQHGT